MVAHRAKPRQAPGVPKVDSSETQPRVRLKEFRLKVVDCSAHDQAKHSHKHKVDCLAHKAKVRHSHKHKADCLAHKAKAGS